MTTPLTEPRPVRWAPRFFAIWTGQAFSLLGSMLVQFALVWWLTQTTGSATVLATATLVAVLPGIFLGPLAGALVDRWNRRIIMIVADSLIALVTLGLIYLYAAGRMEVWQVYIAMFLRAALGVPLAGHAVVHLADGSQGTVDPHRRPQSDIDGDHEHHLATVGRTSVEHHAPEPRAGG